jgi:hypothetical protein
VRGPSLLRSLDARIAVATNGVFLDPNFRLGAIHAAAVL